MRVDGFGNLTLAQMVAQGGGSALIQSGSAQGSISPRTAAAARQAMITPELQAALTAEMPATTEARCDCLLSAIPGLASAPDQLSQGRALCLQDPDAFEQQVRAAGWNPVCGTTDVGVGGAAMTAGFLSTTGGKVAVGLGLTAAIGVAIAAARGMF
jgi:hypothetical protein